MTDTDGSRSPCRTTRFSRTLLPRQQTPLSLLLLFLLFSTVVHAQESPKYNVPKFDRSVSHRTNVCDRQARLWNATVDLPDALRGLELSVAITNYNNSLGKERLFFALDANNKIIVDYPGYFAILLDEVARRAGFTWRNSFGVHPPRNNQTDIVDGVEQSWTDILLWAIDTYDISMEKWGQSLSRMSLGASFPLGFWDSSVILGELYSDSQDRTQVNLWGFLDPFDYSVWLGILGACIFTGMTYWVLEFWNTDTDDRDLDGKPVASIFYAAIAFTGHYELRPNTNAARLVGFSFTFWSLIVASAYTANMASFLVTPRYAVFKYSTIEDALAKKAKLCVQGGAILETILNEEYGDRGIMTVGKDSEKDIFTALRVPTSKGGCDAVAHQFHSYEMYEHDKTVNFDCTVASEKKVQLVLPAGMATKVDNGPISRDDGDPSKCTSLISHVLDYHLTNMANDGFLKEAWHQHLGIVGTIECFADTAGGGEGGNDEETFSLTVQDVGGIFIVHAVLSAVAMLLAVYQFYRKAKTSHTGDSRTLETVFGVHAARKASARMLQKLESKRSSLAGESTRTGAPDLSSGPTEFFGMPHVNEDSAEEVSLGDLKMEKEPPESLFDQMQRSGLTERTSAITVASQLASDNDESSPMAKQPKQKTSFEEDFA